jgi:DNA-binding PadR family transcriptional regulator
VKPRELLRLVTLVELSRGPAHGYALLDRLPNIERNTGGVYRMLNGLADEGLVEATWDAPERGPARRVYSLTELGHRHMLSRRHALHDHVRTCREALAGIPRS